MDSRRSPATPAITPPQPGREPLAVPDDPVLELERLRQRLALVGAAARIGIWEYDFETGELWFSDELAALYGLRPEELTWPEFVARLHPDDVVAPLVEPTPSHPFGEVNEFLFRVRHADGTYRHIRSRSTTHGRDGVPLRKLGVHIDMSEDALFRLARMTETTERLRQFSVMAAHDLRSPLRAIHALIHFILDDHGADLPDGVGGTLGEIDERVGRLSRLVGDLLNIAAADLREARPVATDIAALLGDVVAVTDRRQCRLSIACEVDRPLRVTAHPLASCVRNLVDNACKHNDKSTGTVAVTARLDGPWLLVEVVDDGPGLPEAAGARPFEPFWTTDSASGSGLGLSHVRQEADRNDASLQVRSEPGTGTAFTLRWPVLAATAEP